MRRLRFHRPPDALSNDLRKRSNTLARWIYLLALFGGMFWLGDLLFGSYLYFRSEGMVLAPSSTIATEYSGTVRSLNVREGDRVTRGTRIASVTSQQVAQSIADLTAQIAARRARIADLRIRFQTVAAMLDLASQRDRIISGARRQVEGLQERGILPLDKLTAAVEAEYRSRYDIESLRAERDAITAELANLQPVVAKAEAALVDLQALYSDGMLDSPIDGVIGRLTVSTGSVALPGQPLAEIYSDHTHVTAFLPAGTLYQVQVGDRVRIIWGVRELGATIEAIEPMAAALPKEFQKSFKPVDRAQVLRVTLDTAADMPPLFTKVRLRDEEVLLSLFGRLRVALAG